MSIQGDFNNTLGMLAISTAIGANAKAQRDANDKADKISNGIENINKELYSINSQLNAANMAINSLNDPTVTVKLSEYAYISDMAQQSEQLKERIMFLCQETKNIQDKYETEIEKLKTKIDTNKKVLEKEENIIRDLRAQVDKTKTKDCNIIKNIFKKYRANIIAPIIVSLICAIAFCTFEILKNQPQWEWSVDVSALQMCCAIVIVLCQFLLVAASWFNLKDSKIMNEWDNNRK